MLRQSSGVVQTGTKDLTRQRNAYNRTICRYHWTSDTINGRIVGAATSAVLRSAKDFDYMLDVAKEEL